MSVSSGFIKEEIPGFGRVTTPLFVQPTDKHARPVKQNPPENDLVRFAEGLYRISKTWRDNKLGMMDRWRTFRSWFLNSASSSTIGTERSITYVNLIYEKIEKLTADVAEGRPTLLYTPNTIRDVAMVELLNEAVPFIWSAHNMDQVYFRTIKANNLYGTWYWKILHDPRYGKVGTVEKIAEVPVWNIFPAPHSTDIQSCPWMIEVKVRTVGEIEADYGVKVDPEIGVSDDLFPPIEEDLKNISSNFTHVVGTADGDGTTSGDLVQAIPDTFFGAQAGRAGFVIQKELWIRDGTTVGDWWFDEGDGQGVPELKKTYSMKYPGGRVISWANGRLLYDRPNPYTHARFPYVKFTDISVPDFWYGLGEVEPLINLQLLHDDTHEIIKQIHLYTALGRLVVDEGTGLQEDQMGNDPGEIWWVKPGTADRVKWLAGSAPNAELYTYLSTLERSSDLVTGSFDVTRGINPTGVTAGRALSTLQTAANIRIRARLKDIEGPLVEAGRQIAALIQQFWPSDLTLRVVGQEKISNLPENPFQFKDFSISAADRIASFNVEVSASANIDQLRQQEFQRMVMLMQLGVPIAPEELIHGANLTNENKILADLARISATQGIPQAGGPTPPNQQIAAGAA